MRPPAILFLITGAVLTAQPARFEGVVTNAVTHEPLSGVDIHLTGTRRAGRGETNTFGAVSDRSGHFAIGSLPAGSYLLMPRLRGFIYGQAKRGAIPAPSLLVKAGQNLIDFNLEMTPRAVITGRVLDEFGDAVESAFVEAELVSKDIVIA